MQFTTTILASTALALGLFIQSAAATDYRQLVKHSSEDGNKFCNEWRCACINYKPLSSKVDFSGALCEVGDYHGKHTKTLAKVVCLYHDSNATGNNTAVVYTKQIAKQLGATYTSD